MSEKQGLAIGIADKPLRGTPLIHHSCLFLMDRDCTSVLQQLHFTNTQISSIKIDSRMRAFTRDPMTMEYARTEKGYTVNPYIAGEMKPMLSIWNHMLKYGVHINRRSDIHLDDDFDKNPKAETLNCRAAVAAALKTAHLKLSRHFTAEDYGIDCARMPLGPIFSFSVDAEKGIDDVFAEWKQLSGNLPPPRTHQTTTPFDLGMDWNT